jgi:hypothetical protein
MMTPASPWMGSSRTATVFSSMDSATAPASPKGTRTNPGVNGPNPARADGSSEKPTIVVVRPWKLPPKMMIVAVPSGTPFVS